MNKRLVTVMVVQLISALLIALNNKIGLGLDVATVTALAGSMGATAIAYMWSQAKTDVAENAENTDEA